MHRFFVDKKIDENHFSLDQLTLKHIKVARLEKDHFYCNFNAQFYECILENNYAKILTKTTINNEYQQAVILAAPIIKNKRFEWILQKATELGTTKIIPLVSQYTENNLVKNDFKESKYTRYYEILKNAAQQSFRNIIPSLDKPTKLEDILKANHDKKIFIAYENETSSKVISLPTNSLLIVGPEGGFSEAEITLASKYKANVINLGKTILRAETACLTLLSKVIE